MQTTEAKTEGWTEARVTLLRKLYAEGTKSASQIADQIPGEFSRNAVIGKLHRLGLVGRTTAARPRNASLPLKPSRVTQGHRRTHRNPDIVDYIRKVEKCQIQAGVLPPIVRSAPLPVREPEDISSGVTLLELKEHSCRWPLGGHLEKATLFCGAPKVPGKSYCSCHSARAFQRSLAKSMNIHPSETGINTRRGVA